MSRYIIQKALSTLLTLFLIASFTFIMIKSVPGDPFSEEKALPQEVLDALMAHYGLDKPLPEQYLRYLGQLIKGDLGPSLKYPGRQVNQIIADGFPVSALLGTQALMLALGLGTAIGALAATYHNRWKDRLAMALVVLGISIPSFIAATLLQYFFAIKLSLLPIARWGTFAHTILPSLSLSFLPTAFIARLTRASMLEVLRQDYIRTAQAKGLSMLQIIYRHALRNALLPVVSYLGPMTANIMTGTFIIERIYGIPGLGQWLVLSIYNRDYAIIMGVTLFYSALLLLTNFLVDLLYFYIDPRIQYKEEG